jgi:L-alanine-DL-glutamate epimerase-like enolase superfamily enzyme
MIVSLEAWQVEIPLRIPFKHARFEHRCHRCIYLRLNTKNKNIFGLGECIPRHYLTGESSEDVMDWLSKNGHQWLGQDFRDLDLVFKKLRIQCQEASKNKRLASSSGLDIALYDLCSKVTQIPILNLLWHQISSREAKPNQEEIFVNAPIGLSAFQKTQIVAFMALGFRRFKIKIADRTGVEKIGPWTRTLSQLGFEFIIDCNGAFAYEEARDLLTQASKHGILAVEEPLKRTENSLDHLRSLAKEYSSVVKVIVDEHLVTLEDGLNWGGEPVVRNFRLGKNGGFTGILSHLDLLCHNSSGKFSEISGIFSGSLVGEGLLMGRASHLARSLYGVGYIDPSWGCLLLKANPQFDRGGNSPAKRLSFLGNNKHELLQPKALVFDLAQWENYLGLGVYFQEKVIKPYCKRYEKWCF